MTTNKTKKTKSEATVESERQMELMMAKRNLDRLIRSLGASNPDTILELARGLYAEGNRRKGPQQLKPELLPEDDDFPRDR